MKRMKLFIVIWSIYALASTGCIHVGAPYDLYIDNTTPGAKEGRASRYTVLWAANWGDSGVAAAAKNGGIKTINHMDQELTVVLFGFYIKQTTVVYGD